MKLFRGATVVLALLLVLAVGIVYLGLDRIVKKTVERESSSSLKLNSTLNSARLSLFGGKINLNQLRIASPQGFPAPHMLELGDTDVAVSYRQLREDPIHVKSLTLSRPILVIEQSNGAVNFKKAMDLMPRRENSREKPMKLIIDVLKVQDAQVMIHPGLPGMPVEITVPVPSITLENVGKGEGSQNGAAIKDVAMQVITALAGSASESGSLPAELKTILHANVANVVGKLSAESQKRIAAAIPGELGKNLSGVVKDPQALAKDPTKALQQDLGGMVGGKTPKRVPRTR